MNAQLRNRLLAVAATLALGGGGMVVSDLASRPSDAVVLAMEIGKHYESSGRHIGTPYVDRIGKGQPLTVCAGVTGPEVVAGRYYTREDCHRLELPKYLEAERHARAVLRHWDSYNRWVQASIIDMRFNLGPAVLASTTTLVRLANAGDLAGACQQMPRWVYGTVDGRSVVLAGLVDRRATTRELCAEWGGMGISVPWGWGYERAFDRQGRARMGLGGPGRRDRPGPGGVVAPAACRRCGCRCCGSRGAGRAQDLDGRPDHRPGQARHPGGHPGDGGRHEHGG